MDAERWHVALGLRAVGVGLIAASVVVGWDRWRRGSRVPTPWGAVVWWLLLGAYGIGAHVVSVSALAAGVAVAGAGWVVGTVIPRAADAAAHDTTARIGLGDVVVAVVAVAGVWATVADTEAPLLFGAGLVPVVAVMPMIRRPGGTGSLVLAGAVCGAVVTGGLSGAFGGSQRWAALACGAAVYPLVCGVRPRTSRGWVGLVVVEVLAVVCASRLLADSRLVAAIGGALLAVALCLGVAAFSSRRPPPEPTPSVER